MKIILTLRARGATRSRRRKVVEDRVGHIELRENLARNLELVAIRDDQWNSELIATIRLLGGGLEIVDAQGREVASISIEESPQL